MIDDRIPVTARAAWLAPCVLAVALGTAALDQMVGADEAGWYVVWPVLALVVAIGSAIAAGPFRLLLVGLVPTAAITAVRESIDGMAELALLPVWVAGICVLGVSLRRYRWG